MSTHEDLFAFLSAQAGITALVGDRIYPELIPQGAAFPCVLFDVENDGGFKDFDGQGECIRSAIQIDCFADSLEAALAIAAVVRGIWKNYAGAMGTRTVNRASLESEYQSYEELLGGGKYRASLAWTLWHN